MPARGEKGAESLERKECMTLGEKLVQLRKVRGMSQEALAAQIAVSRQAVSRWESGDTLPDVENILQLSRIFGVTTDYLLREEYGTEELSAVDAAEKRKGLAEQSAPFSTPKISEGRQPEKKAGRGLLIAGCILSGIALAGHLTIWVLSTMIPSFYDAVSADEHGNIWYTTGTGFSYSGFIEKYRLFAVVGILWLLLVLGAALLLWYYYKWKESRVEKEKL